MRVIIVSNRLPVTINATENGIEVKPSIGGLAKGLDAFLNHYKTTTEAEYLWVGWAGVNLSQYSQTDIHNYLHQLNCFPIEIPDETMEKFYTGFCNKTIWPLFHYLAAYFSYDEDDWQVYKQINQAFCDTIAAIIKPNDIVWIQDYHLLLLPECLRNKAPNIAIGLFLHIPFPSFEIFQFLPQQCRTEILDGMLGADLIGFHTHEYSQHFTKCVVRMVGYEYNIEHITTNDHLVKVEVYPMGIDFYQIQKLLDKKSVAKQQNSILENIRGEKIILSLDRLDYTKGVANRLYAYEKFLSNNPNWYKKVVLILIVAPSREQVSHYATIKRQIDELVGAINGKFGTVDWAPILYQYKSFSTEELIALYAASDIALVTPITDGMNLIAKEYVAAKTTSSGALILSETAGAAKELMDAIIVNPNSTIEMATAISQALEMTESEKMARLHTMQARLARYNVITWGTSFITDLLAMQETQANFLAKFIQPMQIETILERYKQAASRLLILDYDGTLVPINKNPKLAIPNNNILNILNRLAKNPKNQVIVVSGRNKVELQKWLNLPKLLIVAEHGAWIKKKSKWTMSKSLDPNFKKSLLVILEAFMDKLPGSFIEEKDFSLAWHYRNSHHEKASRLVKELTDTLITLTANTELQILPGKKVVEIKHASVNKGIIEQFITKDNSEFILGIGDDITDEDMFRVIPPHHFSLKVGPGASHARFNVRTQNDVVQILDKLTNY